MARIFPLVVLGLVACQQRPEDCRGSSTVISTAAGTPTEASCPHKNHKMKVTMFVDVDGGTVKESSALVTCECETSVKP